MASGQQERSELDRMAREGETVVPGGTGGKTLEAQEHLADGMLPGAAAVGRLGRSSWGRRDTARWVTRAGRLARSSWGRRGTARWGTRAGRLARTSSGRRGTARWGARAG
ncbi:unnamed protein product [Triticum turgidum subsp. durum]|uniref:Uncharacterized protein n=1 Tax=Triticum turgidum subsp. durum TaxID=4567 RepID=A0A9R0QXC5_TRITD|nr:unnamed protein product [Triticum turgidum subsp. durum]